MELETLVIIALAAVAAVQPASALPADTCRQGFVWRDAVPGDLVCVTPGVRQQAADDNAQATARRQPGGGAYGPATCLPGFVWREAVPNDLVCVTPGTRDQTAADNRAAAGRRVGANTSLDPPHEQKLPVVNEKCEQYARRALDQFRIMQKTRKCQLPPDGRWHTDYKRHYDWCLTSRGTWRNEMKIRDDHLDRCGGQSKL
jgi:hypothetical protein